MSEIMTGDPAELVGTLLSSPAPSDVFNLRRVKADGSIVDYPVRVRLLRAEESHAALIAAQQYAKQKQELSKEYGDVYREGQAIEVIWRSLCHVEMPTGDDGNTRFRNIFVSAQQLRASFTELDMAQCLNMVELVKAKYGAIETFTSDEFEMWIDRLSRGFDGVHFLALLSSSDWPRLILSLAQEVRRLQTLLPSPPTSDSDPESSPPGTGDSSTLPSAQSRDGLELPTDHVMTSDEARGLVRGVRKPDPE